MYTLFDGLKNNAETRRGKEKMREISKMFTSIILKL